MNDLRDALEPLVRTTGGLPSIDELRGRRSRRRARRAATASMGAMLLGLIAVVALTTGGGSGRYDVRTGHGGGGESSAPSTAGGSRHTRHTSGREAAPPTTTAAAPADRVPTTDSAAGHLTEPPKRQGTVTHGPAPQVVPGTPGAPTVTSASIGPNLVGTGVFGTDGADASGGKGTATVTWTAPADDGGSPITSYWVQAMYLDGGTGPGCRVGGGATACVVKGLIANRPATFFVQASNASGAGAISPASRFTVTAPVTTPNVPLIANPAVAGGEAATAGDGSATVTWSQPIYDGGSPITGYLVRSYRSDGSPGPTCSAPASARRCVVGGLVNGTTYTFRVLATNAVGLGDPSIVSNAVTPAAG
jgi:titin